VQQHEKERKKGKYCESFGYGTPHYAYATWSSPYLNCECSCVCISLFKYAQECETFPTTLHNTPPATSCTACLPQTISRSSGSKSHVSFGLKNRKEEERKKLLLDIFRLSAGKFNGKRRVSKSTLATPTSKNKQVKVLWSQHDGLRDTLLIKKSYLFIYRRSM